MKKSGNTGRQRGALPESLLRKQILLPLPDNYVRDTSLATHLALEGCRPEEGNCHLFHVLSWTVYLSFYLWRAGFGTATTQAFQQAEQVLDRVAQQAEAGGAWRITDGDSAPVAQVLCLYDRQLLSVPTGVFLESRLKLDRLVRLGGSISPIRDFCALDKGHAVGNHRMSKSEGLEPESRKSGPSKSTNRAAESCQMA